MLSMVPSSQQRLIEHHYHPALDQVMETDEGNFPRKHRCGDAQLENKCSQSGIQNLMHSSASEIKRDRA